MEHLKKQKLPHHHHEQENLGRKLINRRRWRDRFIGLFGAIIFVWMLNANLSFANYRYGVGCGYWPFWTGAASLYMLIYVYFIRNLVRAINEHHRYSDSNWHGIGKTTEAYSVIFESVIICLIFFLTMAGFILFGVRCIFGYNDPILIDQLIGITASPTPIPLRPVL